MTPVTEGKEKPGDAAAHSFGYTFFALCFLGSVLAFALLSVCHHPPFSLVSELCHRALPAPASVGLLVSCESGL